MDKRPNYFVLIDLDPAIEDAAVIAKAIQDKRAAWVKQQNMGTPAASGAARANLARVPDIQSVLGDPETRRAEAADARQVLKEERQAGFVQLDEMLALLRAGEICTSEDIDRIVKTFAGRLSEQDVKDRVRAMGLVVQKAGARPDAAKQAAKPRFDAARMDQLRPSLKLLGAKDLYGFLELTARASRSNLWQHADERNRELLRVGRNDAESNAAKALCGHCLSIFDSDENRQKYDNSLAMEAMESLRPVIEMAGSGGKFLNTAQQEEIVKQARSRGVDPADARAFLEGIAATRKWGLARTKTLEVEALPQCGYCQTLASSSKLTHCGHCGQSLFIACPGCSKSMSTMHAACTSCGFAIGDWSWIRLELDKARKLQDELRIDEAQNRLRAVGRNAPGWPPAKEALAAVERLVAERQSERDRLDVLLRDKKLFECQSAIERFRKKWRGNDTDKLSSAVGDGLRQARQVFEEAERLRLSGAVEDALVRYRKVLSLCSDHGDARNAMALIPPSPPSELSVTAQGAGFQLRWKAADKTVDDYVVLRNRTAPAHARDGTVCLTTSDTTGTDGDVPEGVAWHYAAFSRRDTVTSARAARSGPHLRMAGIRDLRTVPGQREVVMRWRPPEGCIRVEVWRRERVAPERPGIGTRLINAIDSLHDSGLNDDIVYGYLLVPVFANPLVSDATQPGPATSCTAVPTAPPRAIMDLAAKREGDFAKLSWTVPAPNVQVQIRQLKSLQDVAVGAVLSKEGAEQIGTPVSSSGPGTAQVRLSAVAEVHFVPLSIKAATVVVGQPVSVVTIQGVSRLKPDTDGRDIRLTWDWPAGATRAAVCYSYDASPGTPQDPSCVRKYVSLEEYARVGHFTITKAERRLHYISVFVITDSGRLYSEPATAVAAMGREREFTYRLVKPRRFLGIRLGSRSHIELQIRGTGALPETVLVLNPRVVPLHTGDGQKAIELPALTLDGEYNVALKDVKDDSNSKAKLFFVDPRHAQEIRLNSAN